MEAAQDEAEHIGTVITPAARDALLPLPAYADAPRTHLLLSALCVVLVSCWEQLLLLAADHRTVRSL